MTDYKGRWLYVEKLNKLLGEESDRRLKLLRKLYPHLENYYMIFEGGSNPLKELNEVADLLDEVEKELADGD